MFVEKNLNISDISLFEVIKNSLIDDVKECTGRVISEVEEGFEYSKKLQNKMKQNGDVLVKVKHFKPCSIYEVEFFSSQGVNFMRYEAEKIDDENTKVRYSEGFYSDKKLNNLNYKMMMKCMKKSVEKRMNMILLSTERYIINQQKEAELKKL